MAEITDCPLCGTPCRVVGNTTMHYEPVTDKNSTLGNVAPAPTTLTETVRYPFVEGELEEILRDLNPRCGEAIADYIAALRARVSELERVIEAEASVHEMGGYTARAKNLRDFLSKAKEPKR